MNTQDKLIKIIAKELDMKPNQISSDDSFENLGIDSLTGIEIVLAVEKEFGKEYPEDAPPPKTIKDIVDFLEK
jgi:acyl carrier protein